MSEHKGHSEIELGSDRSFGFVFAVVFAAVAFYPLLSSSAPRWWAVGIAAAFVVAGALRPAVLRPLNFLWFRFGLLLGRVVTPIVMLIIFVTTVVPIGLIMRLRKRDPLLREFDAEADSYWIPVDQGAARSSSMRRQF